MNAINLYIFLGWVTFLSTLALMTMVMLQARKSTTNTFFLLFLTTTAFLALNQSISTITFHGDLFLLFEKIGHTLLVVLPVAFLLFVLSFSFKDSLLKSFLFLLVLVIVIRLMVVLAVESNWLWVYDFEQVRYRDWGLEIAKGPYIWVFQLWIEGLFLFAMGILINDFRNSQNIIHKQQTKLVFISILFPFVGSFLSLTLFPAFGLEVFPVSVLFNTIQAFIIGYAILKYNLVVIDDQLVSPQILKTIPEALVISDMQHKIMQINYATEKMFEYRESELIGKNLGLLFADSKEYDQFLKLLSKIDTAKEHQNVEMVLLSKSQQKIPVIANYSTLGPGQNPDGKIILLTDISVLKERDEELRERIIETQKQNQDLLTTKEAMANLLEDSRAMEQELVKEKESVELKVLDRTKELTQEQTKLQASIDSLNLGFIITNTNSRVVRINDAAKHILCVSGSSRSRPGIFTKLEQVDVKCDIEDIEKLLLATFDLRKEVLNSINNRKPQEFKDVPFLNFFLHILINPIIDAKNDFQVLGSVVLVEDVTDERVLQRSRDEFFSIASHELRTPLTAIRGNTSMIQQFYPQILEDKNLKEMVDDIHDSSVRLIEIVNDFLDSSRLEQGRMQFKKEVVNLSEVVESVLKEYQLTSSKRELQLHWEEPSIPLAPVLADRDKLRQVLINLVGNSLKFTEKGGVTLRAENEYDFVKVYVQDTGRGIAKENQNLLFRKFQQAGNSIITRDAVRGTGLGLYISKLEIEGMGGKIQLENSTPGVGTVFSFTLPIAPGQEAVFHTNENEVKST